MGFNRTGKFDLENVLKLHDEVVANTKADATQEENLDILWLLFGAYLVFFMQVRRTVFEAPFIFLFGFFPPAYPVFFFFFFPDSDSYVFFTVTTPQLFA